MLSSDILQAMSDRDLRVRAHALATQLKDACTDPPVLAAAGAGLEADPDVAGALRHGSFDGTHEHPHADGSGGVHHHAHSHEQSATHDHAHSVTQAGATPGPATTTEGSADVEFSDEQMAGIRKALGKNDGDAITSAEVIAALTAVPAPAGVLDASSGVETPELSEGTYLVDAEIIKQWQNAAAAGLAASRQLVIRERDTILAAAVAAGKFPQARLPHYEMMWDRDPDGTRKHVETLASGLVPMRGPVGQNPNYDPDMGGDFEGQSAYRELYPEDAGTPAAGYRR